jgi:hypothetical protein
MHLYVIIHHNVASKTLGVLPAIAYLSKYGQKAALIVVVKVLSVAEAFAL